jgi:hypothetical protein
VKFLDLEISTRPKLFSKFYFFLFHVKYCHTSSETKCSLCLIQFSWYLAVKYLTEAKFANIMRNNIFGRYLVSETTYYIRAHTYRPERSNFKPLRGLDGQLWTALWKYPCKYTDKISLRSLVLKIIRQRHIALCRHCIHVESHWVRSFFRRCLNSNKYFVNTFPNFYSTRFITFLDEGKAVTYMLGDARMSSREALNQMATCHMRHACQELDSPSANNTFLHKETITKKQTNTWVHQAEI